MSQTRHTKPVYVKPSSVPMCLRHVNSTTALEEAQALAAFLQDATEVIVENENGTSENCGWGLSLVFQLLRDKLAIASGELAFPLTATTDEDTWRTLWNPNAGGDDE